MRLHIKYLYTWAFVLLRTTSENRPHRKEGESKIDNKIQTAKKKNPRKQRFRNEISSMMNL